MLKKVFPLFLTFFFFSTGFFLAGNPTKKEVKDLNKQQWVDQWLKKLSLEEKIGQLFMVAAYSNKDQQHYRNIKKLIKGYSIGGLIFFQGNAKKQAQLTNKFQELSKVPLLIGMDAEWGLGMRLDSAMNFPRQMTLGAIRDNELIYDMGSAIARDLKRLGVHINFAPVVDINSNPDNPVIGTRSFGETKSNVASKGLAYMRGLQNNGIIAVAKHFPGHGDTKTDSHHTLPVVRKKASRLWEKELYPFQNLIENGLMGTMVAHLNVPAYYDIPGKPATLATQVVNDLLKEKMGFNGLVFTDALNMAGISGHYESGEADLLALLAGNDVLLYPKNVPKAIAKIKEAVRNDVVSLTQLNQHVKKILEAKYFAGLHNYQPVELRNIHADLTTTGDKLLKQRLYENAVTIVKNSQNQIPQKILDTTTYASLAIGVGEASRNSANSFRNMLDNYATVQHYELHDKATAEDFSAMQQKLVNYGHVIVGLYGMNNSREDNYGISKENLQFLHALNRKTNVIITVFGNPYSLTNFEEFEEVICAYEEDETVAEVIPQIIFGGLKAKGELPVSAGEVFPVGTGHKTESLKRLSYSYPEAVGMKSEVLANIDNIVEQAIKIKATPGGQVLVARNGKVIFKKAYGYHTYDSLRPVTNRTIYDLASLTKVSATLQAIMFLEERGDIDLDQKISTYLQDLKGTNKEDLIIRDILLHRAGLMAYIPFWRKTMGEYGLSASLYSNYPENKFTRQISRGLYTTQSMEDSIWKWTIQSPLRNNSRREPSWQPEYNYRYSDLGFYLLYHLVEKVTRQPMEDFLTQNFYDPLGLTTTTYLPLCKFPRYRVAPTEKDNVFRNTLLRGMVHDEGAAMCGGVAGHAGIFSNSNDLAILMQMNLQNGYYGGLRYFQEGTVRRFTKQQYLDNPRGLGWDKPGLDNGDDDIGSVEASTGTFGHTGFTGTAVWVDPKYDLVYIFLSNRIHPSASNTKLITHGIRERVHNVIYKSMNNNLSLIKK